MVFRYAQHNGVARNYSGHWLVKSKMASFSARSSYINYHHFRQKGQKSIIFMSTIGFSGMADIVCGWKVHYIMGKIQDGNQKLI